MNYKEFLSQLLDYNEIDFGFIFKKEEKKHFEVRYKYPEILNNIAFAPISKEKKKKCLRDLLNKNVNEIDEILIKKYDEFISFLSDKKKLIQKYMKFFVDWIEIALEIENKSFNDLIVNRIKKKIKIKHNLFWFYLIREIYERKYYSEALSLIRYVKRKYIKKKNYLYDYLLIYEFVALKKAKDYIHDNRWRNEYCKLAKKLNFTNELKILGILECCLLNRQIDTFRQTLKKYRKEILDWSLMNILNAYELAIYTKNNEIIQEVEDMLFIRNIEKCNGLYEFDYFMLLQHIKNRQTEKITEYLRKLKNIFDTCLLEWFYVLVENKEFTFA